MQIKKNPRDCRKRKHISRIAEYEALPQCSWPTNSQKFTIRKAPRCGLSIPVGNMKMEPAPLY